MPRAVTFAEYYSLPTTGMGGDGNVKSFNKAMDPEANLWDATRAFNNADGLSSWQVRVEQLNSSTE
jgi:hypothetical protein